MTEALKKTLLFDWHKQNGARFSGFGGYEMPLWYKAGPIKEHQVVLQQAGLFDTSHMSQLLIEGPEAFTLLQKALSKDLSCCIGKGRPIEKGRATYGFLLNEEGFVLDDAIVMMEDKEQYLLVINAGTGQAISDHLKKLAKGLDVAVSDLTGKLFKLDLQGPEALKILKNILKPTKKLEAPFPYFSFVGHYDHLQEGVQTQSGYSVMVSRTGYTGEFGFELILRPDAFEQTWLDLMEAGEPFGLLPCGLGARDSLRCGAQLPLSHQDIGEWPCSNHPWEFALSKTEDGRFSKDFVGATALLGTENTEHTLTFIGDNGRKVEGGAEVLLEGELLGSVLSCATDMGMDRVDGTLYSLSSPEAPTGFKPKGLSCGFVKLNKALPTGTRIQLKDKRRELEVTVTDTLRPHRSARAKWETMG